MSATPGPWKYQPLMADGMIVSKGGRFEITTWAYDVCAFIPGSGPIRNEDDARLIASAPDLLEVCEALEKYGAARPQIDDTCMHDLFQIIKQARAAIAKAKGE